MRYNQYLYQLSGPIVPITDVVEMSLSVANIITDPIISTPLLIRTIANSVQITSKVNSFPCGIFCFLVVQLIDSTK